MRWCLSSYQVSLLITSNVRIIKAADVYVVFMYPPKNKPILLFGFQGLAHQVQMMQISKNYHLAIDRGAVNFVV